MTKRTILVIHTRKRDHCHNPGSFVFTACRKENIWSFSLDLVIVHSPNDQTAQLFLFFESWDFVKRKCIAMLCLTQNRISLWHRNFSFYATSLSCSVSHWTQLRNSVVQACLFLWKLKILNTTVLALMWISQGKRCQTPVVLFPNSGPCWQSVSVSVLELPGCQSQAQVSLFMETSTSRESPLLFFSVDSVSDLGRPRALG